MTINTYFMPLVGQPTVTVSAESEVRRGGANVEVALALDITASMTMGVDRMTPLRAAATDLINTVVTDTQTPFYSRVAIVPWGSTVHVGALADELRGDITGPVNITAATWRDGTAAAIANATSTGWRKNAGGETISDVTWINGNATITSITKLAGPARVRVTVSANPGYTNGDTVYISGANGSYTYLNGNRYTVADRTTVSPWTFTLQTVGTSTYVTPPAGTTNSTAGSSKRCFNAGCEIRVTASTNTNAAGDFIYLSGVGSPYSAINSASGTSWTISSLTTPTTTVFFLSGSNGPSVTTSTSAASAGTASECFSANCKFLVTANAHGLSNGNSIYIAGATVSGSGTSMNSSSGGIWTVENATTNTFTLPGNGPSYRDGHSGTAQKCFTNTCEVRVTAAGHGLLNSQYTQISGVVGMTSLNQTGNTSWQVEGVAGDNFVLSASTGPSYSNYTSGGASQCLAQGCAKYRYTEFGGGPVIKPITDCVSERLGDEAATDAGPEDGLLGRYYPAGGYNICGTGNRITPLTDNKEALNDHIQDLVVSGSTAGQIALGWGWYMISPSWASLWDSYTSDFDDDYTDPIEYFGPAEYDAPNTSKVIVLMTDGEFNTAHCEGVASSNFSVTSSSDVNSCTATDPFTQAAAICDAIDPDAEDDKMIIFTIGFEIDPLGEAAGFLEECASKPEYFFLSESGTDLQADFKKIAKEISKLRIAK